MACSCKQIKKVGEKMDVFKVPTYDKKGLKGILKWLKNGFLNALNALCMSLCLLLLLPLIIVIVFFNLLFSGKNVINIPFKKILGKGTEKEVISDSK
jgi:hypothetical protein